MNDFKTYLSTAPVLLTIWMSFTAGLLIEIKPFLSRRTVYRIGYKFLFEKPNLTVLGFSISLIFLINR